MTEMRNEVQSVAAVMEDIICRGKRQKKSLSLVKNLEAIHEMLLEVLEGDLYASTFQRYGRELVPGPNRSRNDEGFDVPE